MLFRSAALCIFSMDPVPAPDASPPCFPIPLCIICAKNYALIHRSPSYFHKSAPPSRTGCVSIHPPAASPPAAFRRFLLANVFWNVLKYSFYANCAVRPTVFAPCSVRSSEAYGGEAHVDDHKGSPCGGAARYRGLRRRSRRLGGGGSGRAVRLPHGPH